MVSNRRKVVFGLGVGLLLLAITGVAFAAGTVWGRGLVARLGIRPQLQVAEKSPSCPTPRPLSTLLLPRELPVVPLASQPAGWPDSDAELPYQRLRGKEQEVLIFSGKEAEGWPWRLSWPFPQGEGPLARIVAGEVVRVAGDTLTVRTAGEEQAVRLTECTVIWRGATRTAAELRPGDRILLSGYSDPGGPIIAEIVVILPLEGP